MPACVLQIYQVSPSTLLPVMPHIMSDLTAKEDAKRLSALELLGKLYALPNSDMQADFPELFKEFVRRSKDQKVCNSLNRLSISGDCTKLWSCLPTNGGETPVCAYRQSRAT
jgi:sister-chromatid-cohesion protein PDS5